MNRAFVQGEWARVIAATLADCGVRDVLISPGSRSTPLVWAVLDCSRLVSHSVVDERGAAFAAVARAKVSGRPAALVCTSGTAAANYFPAVVEASMSHTPLVVLTADRPHALSDSGANQTIDQIRLYGAHVRHFVELGPPEASHAALRSLRRRVAQSIALAQGNEPGPVHLNVRAHKPLEPTAACTEEEAALHAEVESLLQRPPVQLPSPVPAPSEATVSELCALIERSERPLITCGPIPPARTVESDVVGRFAAAAGAAVYAEATSGLRFVRPALPSHVDGFPWLLRAGLSEELEPDCVFQLGAAPTSGAILNWLERGAARSRVCLAHHGHPDPDSGAQWVVRGNPTRLLAELSSRLQPRGRRAWLAGLAETNERVWQTIEAVLDETERLTEPRAIRAVLGALPERSLLAVGNSLPVRLVDDYGRASPTDCRVWSQRGASGIDGLVSGGLAAVAEAERPGVVLLGDLSLLHDLGGLATARAVRAGCALVVVNNGGGRIFESLPIAEAHAPSSRLRFWTTPHALRFEAAAAVFSLPFRRATTPQELHSAIRSATLESGVTLVEAVVEPSSARDVTAAVRHRLGGGG